MVHMGKAREIRRPVQEGITARGWGARSWSKVRNVNPAVRTLYFTFTGLCLSAGKRLQTYAESPSVIRVGRERIEVPVGNDLIQTAPERTAVEAYAAMRAAPMDPV
eukprot:CAMPEP_0194421292 /NCGR_PEP_ID=MMETSP0176-20130528/20490_1 /TAXON_ID=216777 /ORGANISM="Proboscia alata, Strain PI-D3" /LENGTH=105 /DNA_ID=CAMNT_0039229285 /DNA_START=465 /DNA_END=782 /DNA_ORIENTATION=-